MSPALSSMETEIIDPRNVRLDKEVKQKSVEHVKVNRKRIKISVDRLLNQTRTWFPFVLHRHEVTPGCCNSNTAFLCLALVCGTSGCPQAPRRFILDQQRILKTWHVIVE